MTKFFAGLLIPLIIAVATAYYGNESAAPPRLTDEQIERKQQAEQAAFVRWQVLWSGLTIALLVAALGGGYYVIVLAKNKRERIYVDPATGLYPMLCEDRAPFWARAFGGHDWIERDPNLAIAPNRRIHANGNVTIEPDLHGATIEQQMQYAAQLLPIRRAIAQSAGNTRMNTAMARAAAGVYDAEARRKNALADVSERRALPSGEQDVIDGEYTVAPPSLHDILAESTPNNFILGHNPKQGIRVAFDPAAQQNIGIVGAQGTGKTASSGYHVLMLALKFGYHPIILDPKGGVDFRQFGNHCEWHATDADSFGGHMMEIRREHDRRHEILVQREASNIDELRTCELPHILVFIEEYGALWEEIEASKKRAEIERINGDIDTMMRLARMTGIHFCFVDQFPEKWSPQVFMAMKFRIVYQVAPGQDAFLQEWKAAQLPDRGWFQHRRNQYQAWHVKPELRTLLAELPASQHERLIDGVHENVLENVHARSLVYDPTALGENGGDITRWSDLVADWFSRNPWALTGPAVGITDIARLMAQTDNRPGEYENYKSIAHRLYHEFRKSIRLPRGDRLGTDTTHGPNQTD